MDQPQFIGLAISLYILHLNYQASFFYLFLHLLQYHKKFFDPKLLPTYFWCIVNLGAYQKVNTHEDDHGLNINTMMKAYDEQVKVMCSNLFIDLSACIKKWIHTWGWGVEYKKGAYQKVNTWGVSGLNKNIMKKVMMEGWRNIGKIASINEIRGRLWWWLTTHSHLDFKMKKIKFNEH